MRTRLALLLALVLLVPVLGTLFAPAYAAGTVTFAQDTGGDEVDGSQGGVGEGDETGPAEGQGDADAGSGAGKRKQADTEVEAGPVWTYQMAKIIIVLLLLLLLAIAGAYWKFVAQRQRAGV